MLTEHEVRSTFDNLIALPSETEWVEFKEAKNSIPFNDLGCYFSALSNEANLKRQPCGWLVLGVSDRPPRTVVGTHYRKDRASLDKLSDLLDEEQKKKNKVRNLIQEMSRNGQIRNKGGRGTQARWIRV